MGLVAVGPLLAVVATLAAGLGGLCLGSAWMRNRDVSARRRRVRTSMGATDEAVRREAWESQVMRYAVLTTRRLSLGATTPLLGTRRFERVESWLDAHAKRAGVQGEVSGQGFVEVAVRLGGVGAVVGVLVGAVFSTELAMVGAVAGCVAGATAPPRAIKQAEQVRVKSLGQSLSEMLEVVALGLRSGLSFDRSFQLYGAHFNVPFARECAAAQRAWMFGLTTREESLRNLAASYDAPLLARVVESTIRSLRFGSSLAEILEASAAEARAEHRAQVEEHVAKAPVKMMVPTGTLILPAMLLLVLGPVLLELMKGF